MRFAKVAIVLLSLLSPQTGQAHDDPADPNHHLDPTGALALTKGDFLIRLRRREGDDWVFMNATEAKFFFNRARCECEEPVQVVVELSSSGLAKVVRDGKVKLLLGGTDCLAETETARVGAMCDPPLGEMNLPDLIRGARTINTTVRKLFERKGQKITGEGCATEFTNTLWLSVDSQRGDGNPPDGTPDLLTSAAPSLGLALDGKPPPAPTGLEVTGGNEALSARWRGIDGVPDFEGFVVFCARGGEYPVFADSGYVSQYTFCPSATITTAGQPNFTSTAAPGTGTPVAVPESFRRLDPDYLCSDLLKGQTEARISILQNGIPYVVGVAAVDRRGNASSVESAVLQSPIPTRDFYRGYRAAGGQADGGCAVAGGGAAPFALGLALVALARRCRGGRR